MSPGAPPSGVRFTTGHALGAQVRAEILNRARSTGTLVALFIILIGSYWALPSAEGRAVSLSWTLPDGRMQAPLYTAGYLGIAISVLSIMFLVLAAFYLVAGGVRRDRERGIGLILAASPMSKSAYLGAKWIANALYLMLLSLFVLPVGLYHFLRSGVGAFDAAQFFLPMLFVIVPAASFVSAMALLFDVTPVLRSRGGLVIWFLFGALPLLALPMELARSGKDRHFDHVPAFDPAGIAMHDGLVNASLPPGAGDISSGYIVHDKPVERVAWPGLKFPSGTALHRLLNLLWALIPFGLAVLIFDRFDPAREGRKLRLRRQQNETPAIAATAAAAPVRTLASLGPVAARPGARSAVFAEARLLWETGNWAKWLLIPAVLAAALIPGDGARMAGGALVLLLIPLVSEVACREDLAGARPLVFSQPGVPSSAVLWKFAAVTLFLLVVTLPIVVRGVVTGDARAYAVPLGVLFVAAFAVGSAALSGGGKLFSGVVLLLWYLALNGLGAVDFLGILSQGAEWSSRIAFLAIGAAFLAAAMAVERRRARGV